MRPLLNIDCCLFLEHRGRTLARVSMRVTRIAAERIAIGTCATCHGPQGHSISPKFPVLAGQHANYLVAQLQAFKAQNARRSGCAGLHVGHGGAAG